MRLYYQIDYTLTGIPKDAGYLHAQFRRVNPLPYEEVYTIVKEFPTICGTGTEDYFCGSYNFHVRDPLTNKGDDKGYREFTTPYSGMPQVIRPDGQYRSQMRFGLYRWHIVDPVRFEKDLRITIQALGWRDSGYLPLQDDISSVAFWYQKEPHSKFPKLPEKEFLNIH
ncbi:hypothetical protein ES705_41723 [subsurface metagenome]